MLLKRNPLVLILTGAIAGLALGGVTAYWWLNYRRPLPPEVPFGSNVIPQEALLVAAVSTEERQWQQVRQLGTPETRQLLEEAIAEWRDRLFTANGLDYGADVQPWLGQEVTVAVLQIVAEEPAEESLLPPPEPEQAIVFLLPIADPVEAQARLSSVLEEPSGEAAAGDRDYRGTAITMLDSTGETPYFSTVLNNRVIAVSSRIEAIEQVIDTTKGEGAIANTDGYRQAFGQITAANPFLRLYVNAPVAKDWIAANSNQPAPLLGISPLQRNQGIAATVTVTEAGLQIQGINWLPEDSDLRYETTNGATELVTRLPSNTLMMVSGGNFSEFWQSFNPSGESAAETGNPNAFSQVIQTMTGLDAEQDLLPWMTGEFAVAMVAFPDAAAPDDPAAQRSGIVFLVEASDRPAAEATFTELDAVMSNRYRFQVNAAQLEGQPVVNWVSPFEAISVTRGWLEGDVAFLTLGIPTATLIVPNPAVPLSENPVFQETIAGAPNPNNGHFFINVDAILQRGEEVPIPNLPSNGGAIARAIRAIGVTGAIQNDRRTQFEINVLIRTTNEPPQTPEADRPAIPPLVPEGN